MEALDFDLGRAQFALLSSFKILFTLILIEVIGDKGATHILADGRGGVGGGEERHALLTSCTV